MLVINLQRQHVELLRLATELDAATRAIESPVGPAQARRVCAQLAGRLRVHLAMEDEFLYPTLMDSPAAETAAQARRFADEMGGLAGVFGKYYDQWRKPQAIEVQSTQFVSETKSLISALGTRISREERELYPLVAEPVF